MMMTSFLGRMAPHIRRSVAYLVQDEISDSGAILRKPMATAFFMHRDVDDGGKRTYLVTARHNLEYADKTKTLYLRVNRSDFAFEDLQLSHIEEWLVHCTLDAAMIEFEESWRCDLQSWSIPERYLLDSSAFINHAPCEGTDVCFAALFSAAPGRFQMQPLVRFGKIALMPREPIVAKIVPQNHSEFDAWMIECMAWPGCSGAPVFVDYPDFSGVARREEEYSYCMPIKLLGLVSSHYDLQRPTDSNGFIVPNNSGIAIVVPAQAIRELFERCP